LIIVLLGVIAVLAVGNAYLLRHGQATLMLGRELSESSSGTGFQDAITPPWTTNVQLVLWLCTAIALVAMFWLAGWPWGLLGLTISMVSIGVASALLPKAASPHFARSILGSMSRRYADYVRRGDTTRAHAMMDLLEKAGVTVDSD
jgi:hypothetical protein